MQDGFLYQEYQFFLEDDPMISEDIQRHLNENTPKIFQIPEYVDYFPIQTSGLTIFYTLKI